MAALGELRPRLGAVEMEPLLLGRREIRVEYPGLPQVTLNSKQAFDGNFDLPVLLAGASTHAHHFVRASYEFVRYSFKGYDKA